MNVVIRVGKSHWYSYNENNDEREDAIKDALENYRNIYVSINKKKYREITIEKLREL